MFDEAACDNIAWHCAQRSAPSGLSVPHHWQGTTAGAGIWDD
jgi:hypothetical protein